MGSKDDNGSGPQALFLPAIALMNRMSYTRKFSLLWMLSMAAIAVVVYSLFVSLDRVIQPSEKQLDGLVLIEPISRAIQTIQLHRGVSAALLGGNETLQDMRAAREKKLRGRLKRWKKNCPPALLQASHSLASRQIGSSCSWTG